MLLQMANRKRQHLGLSGYHDLHLLGHCNRPQLKIRLVLMGLLLHLYSGRQQLYLLKLSELESTRVALDYNFEDWQR